MKDFEFAVIGRTDNLAVEKGFSHSNVIRGSVVSSTLQANLNSFVNGMRDVLSKIDTGIDLFQLEEVEVSLEISTSGSVTLIGSVEAGSTGGLTLKFRRTSNEENE